MIKIKIERDGETIMEAPLNENWEVVAEELREFEKDLSDIMDLYRTFTNENRLRMFLDFIEDRRKRFKEFLEKYDLNPKIVASNLDAFRRVGLINRGKRREYILSPLGFGTFIAAVVLRKILRELRGKRARGGEWRRIKVE